ncbi:helix-turn-helix domain-containing protein [Embleya sp. NBC_00896]|uniref:helix-turn-helix domain-containing protein n=1 Tax=Embleya sp. NBC_00896 TaxID=2975961 RepID=UPI00386AFD30
MTAQEASIDAGSQADGRGTRIADGLARGLSYGRIAAELGRLASKITREVARNGGPNRYAADGGHGDSFTGGRVSVSAPRRSSAVTGNARHMTRDDT